jgi:hypothetical protein
MLTRLWAYLARLAFPDWVQVMPAYGWAPNYRPLTEADFLKAIEVLKQLSRNGPQV